MTTTQRQISASVGRHGANRASDVKTVQQLLNGVPLAQGRPNPKLAEDGLNGPKTTKAIQQFQLKHFGWKGTDGRVDPGHQTIAKLNELAGAQKPTASERTNRFLIQPIHDKPFQDPGDERDWFFRISDAQNKQRNAVYFFTIFHRGAGGPKGPVNKGIRTPRADEFKGSNSLIITSPLQMLVNELDCFAHYDSRLTFGADRNDPKNYTSMLTLELIPPDNSPVSLQTIKRVLINAHVNSQNSTSFFGRRLVLMK